jgi:hypothetical protein
MEGGGGGGGGGVGGGGGRAQGWAAGGSEHGPESVCWGAGLHGAVLKQHGDLQARVDTHHSPRRPVPKCVLVADVTQSDLGRNRK